MNEVVQPSLVQDRKTFAQKQEALAQYASSQGLEVEWNVRTLMSMMDEGRLDELFTRSEQMAFVVALALHHDRVDSEQAFQLYISPTLQEVFGQVESFEIDDVNADSSNRATARIRTVTIVRNQHGQPVRTERRWVLAMRYEWGDWVIDGMQPVG